MHGDTRNDRHLAVFSFLGVTESINLLCKMYVIIYNLAVFC